MRRIAWSMALLVAIPYAAHAAKPAKPVSVQFRAGAWVDVDPSGKGHVVEMDKLDGFKDEGTPGSLADIIKKRLRDRIESWEFDPPTKAGVAVSGKTHVAMSMVAEDDGADAIALRIESAKTGSQTLQRPSLMPLVREAGNADGWWLLVHMTIDPQGRVADASVVESKVFDGRKFKPRASNALARATVKTMMQFEFVPELVDGQPIASEGDMPISICMSKACMNADADLMQARNSQDFVSANPVMQLRTAVAGMVL
jgi:hypothetical protein